MNTSHIAYFTRDRASRDAAAKALGVEVGYLGGGAITAWALHANYRPGEPHRARLNMPDARKVLTVSYAGEGTYVATLTDDGTVPNPCDMIRRNYCARQFMYMLDREAEEIDR